MMYLRQTYIHKPGLRLNFLHVLKGSEAPVLQQWKRYLEIVGLNKNLPLEMISSKGDVVEILLETIHSGKYGTIIMGKRGLSGIKRWWLGSVSAGVLKASSEISEAVPNLIFEPGDLIPNDPPFSGSITDYRKARETIGAPKIWSSTPSFTKPLVAVIDTGVDKNHTDLLGKVREGKNFVSPGRSR